MTRGKIILLRDTKRKSDEEKEGKRRQTSESLRSQGDGRSCGGHECLESASDRLCHTHAHTHSHPELCHTSASGRLHCRVCCNAQFVSICTLTGHWMIQPQLVSLAIKSIKPDKWRQNERDLSVYKYNIQSWSLLNSFSWMHTCALTPFGMLLVWATPLLTKGWCSQIVWTLTLTQQANKQTNRRGWNFGNSRTKRQSVSAVNQKFDKNCRLLFQDVQ